MLAAVLFPISALLAAAPAWARPHAVAHLKDLDGKAVGIATFSTVARGVLIEFDLNGLPPGPHGMHLHGAGNCDAKTGFTSAGPVLQVGAVIRKHGYLADGGPEGGDLPNQFAGVDGRLHASVIANGFALGNGKRSIFDHDGVALIVDQRGDDYRTQPLGNAGARIACGVVVRTEGPLPRPPIPAKAH
jgi:superoxide dismutase, Cu-Zn family